MNIRKRWYALDQKDKIIVKHTAVSFLIKGGALAVSFFSTPQLVAYFDHQIVLGVWYTLLSVLSWFLNFDLGLGSGMRNRLVEALAGNDRREARYLLSSGIFSVAGVTVLLAMIGFPLVARANLNAFLNVPADLISPSTLRLSAILVLSSILLRFFLSTVTSVLYALQKSSVNHILSLVGSVLQFLFVTTVRVEDPEVAMIAVSIVYLVTANLPLLLTGLVLFGRNLRDCRPHIRFVSREHTVSVMKLGWMFFVCQLLYMGIMNTNEFLITQLFGPAATTDYTLCYKLTHLLPMIVSLALTPLWSVITKAVAEGDWLWVNRQYQKIKWIGLLVTAVAFLCVPALPFLMKLWIGPETVSVTHATAGAFAAFAVVFVYNNILSTVVCGMGRMKLQAICYAIGVAFKFLFVFVMSRYTDQWTIVVWSNVLLLLPYCLWQQMDLGHYIRKHLPAERSNESKK